MLEKLARARSKLGPKLRAHARARLYLGFQCSYSLGARDFGARPIPSKWKKNNKNKFRRISYCKTTDKGLSIISTQIQGHTPFV